MTPEIFRQKMLDLHAQSEGDFELAHCHADNLLCAALTELGYTEGIQIFEDMEKWYA